MGQFEARLKQLEGMIFEDIMDVAREAVQDVLNHASTPKARGGNMPVQDGHLINSLVSGLNGSFDTPAATTPDKDGSKSKANALLTLAGFDVGDTAQFGWAAAHARRQNNGFVGEDSLGRTYNQPGNHFVERACAEWPRFMEERAKQVRRT